MQSLFNRLDQEWDKLAHDPNSAKDLADVCAGVGARTLVELHAWVRSAPNTETDRVLAPLAARAVEGSELAARVLLQLLMPGTIRLAASWWALGDREERGAAAVAAVYGRIRRYPIDRRPTRIAANVLLDAAQDERGGGNRVEARARRSVRPHGDHRHDTFRPHPCRHLVSALSPQLDGWAPDRNNLALSVPIRPGPVDGESSHPAIDRRWIILGHAGSQGRRLPMAA